MKDFVSAIEQKIKEQSKQFVNFTEPLYSSCFIQINFSFPSKSF